MLSETLYNRVEMGAQHCFLTTQMTNTAMLKVTQKMDFVLGKGRYVFRRIL